MFRKVMVIVLCVCLAFGLLAGCTGNNQKTAESPKTVQEAPKAAAQSTGTAAVSTQASTKAASDGAGGITLPIVDKPLTLQVFIEIDQSKIGAHTSDYNDLLCYKELEKRTGIHIKFLHPPAGQAKEQFNLMVASGDLPDIIYWGWSGITGGPQKAIDDKVILDLKDYFTKYSPNLNGFLNKYPDVRKEMMTDEGGMYVYPYLQHEQIVRNAYGYQTRNDWLKKLNLQAPQTLDEWYNVMLAYRDKDPNGNGKADEIPFVTRGVGIGRTALTGMYGAWGKFYGLYREGDKVKFGPAEPEFKEYMKTMKKWYDEKLLDPDFASLDNQQHDAKIMNSIAGIWNEGLGSGMDRYIMGLGGNPETIYPLNYPSLQKTDKPKWLYGTNTTFCKSGAAIGATSKYPVEAAKWLDYHYSPEGGMILNFGIEGKTYNMINGYPKLVDEIANSKMGVSVALGQYAAGASWEAFLQDARVREQRLLKWDLQKQACELWNKADVSGMMPPITPNGDESQKISTIMNEINTFVDESFLAFVLGKKSIDGEFDSYLKTLKDMKLDEAMKLTEAALKRYLAR